LIKIQRRIPEIYMRDWYGDAPNFGYMVFDLTKADPLIRYNLIDVFPVQAYLAVIVCFPGHRTGRRGSAPDQFAWNEVSETAGK
jgi:hypothetical protein